MKPSEDRLDVLKGKYLKQIETKEAEISAIRQKLMLLDELKAEADNLSLISEPIGVVPNGSAYAGHGFSATGLTDSIVKSISWFGAKPFSPPDMREYLLKSGFKPSGKNFSVSVGTTLKRLAEQKRILKEDLNGRTVYRAKP
jgi:hypothetical protein